MWTKRHLPWAAAVVLSGGILACVGRDPGPFNPPPVIKGPDGVEYYLLERGAYKAYYDAWGRLQRIEYDSNGDGKPDIIAYHDGRKLPYLLEVDEDFDGRVDRWEYYDDSGHLIKIGVSRRGAEGPDFWIFRAADGTTIRKEYDDRGTGKVDRVEVFEQGRLSHVELDSDGDGRIDRWQEWRDGRIVSEDLDTDGDGRADRRIIYDDRGRILRLEQIPRGQ